MTASAIAPPAPSRQGAHEEPSPDTERLVRAAAAGDAQAWEKLVARYSRVIWAVAANYRLSPADAADVYQTVWLRLLEHVSGLRSPGRVGGWLATTTRNECLRTLRRGSREHLVEDDDDLEPRHHEEPEGEAAVLRDERRVAVRRGLSTLSPGRRRLLEMLVEDAAPTYHDVHIKLNVPVGSIGPTRSRCLEVLRRNPELARLV